MELILQRFYFSKNATVSRLLELISGNEKADVHMHLCHVLEDKYRGPSEKKVYGKTAIPAGRYKVVITPSPRFKRDLPLLLEVPGFTGVRIHPGNFPADTEGCLLPGRWEGADAVVDSRKHFDMLFAKLEAVQKRGEEIWLTVPVT